MAEFIPRKASQIRNAPSGGIHAATVQGAIDEVDQRLTLAGRVSEVLADVPLLDWQVRGGSPDGGITPDPAAQACIDALVAAGVPLAAIIWRYVPSAGGSFVMPSVSMVPTVVAPALSSGGPGSFAVPSQSVPASYAVPSLAASNAGPGSFTMPQQTVAATVAPPALSGAQAGSFAAPAQTMTVTYAVPSLAASGGGPSSYVGAGSPAQGFEADAYPPMPGVAVNANDLLVLVANGVESVAESGHTWQVHIDGRASGGYSVLYRYAVGDEQGQTGLVQCVSYYDGEFNYSTDTRIFAFRGTPLSAPFSTHGEASITSVGSATSPWTGRALSGVEAGSLIAFLCEIVSHHGTAVGGGVDTLVSHASGGGIDLGYKANQGGSITAPTMTMDAATTGNNITLVVKGT